ncbi:hypothetical protein EV424DRAFT_1376384 [Suillus variegatus]|nr:hypothetical protein EV424DRAFT_1376384 [Suillus variegatus]
MCISELLLTPLWIAHYMCFLPFRLILWSLRIARYMCFLPLRLILWPFKLLTSFIMYIVGFRRQGVAKGTSAITDIVATGLVSSCYQRFICIPIPIPSLWWLCTTTIYLFKISGAWGYR